MNCRSVTSLLTQRSDQEKVPKSNALEEWHRSCRNFGATSIEPGNAEIKHAVNLPTHLPVISGANAQPEAYKC